MTSAPPAGDARRPAVLHAGAVRAALRTQRAAAWAGIAFSLLCALIIVCIRLVVPQSPTDSGQWLLDPSRRQLVLFALSLVPVAGILFLWFIGVVRDRVGAAEDRLFATVFLGSGLMFIAMLFATVAVATGMIEGVPTSTQPAASSTWGTDRFIVGELTSISMRMAGVFTIATSTIVVRTQALARWTGLVGYVVGVALVLFVGVWPWLQLLFPVWVFLVCVAILVHHFRQARAATPLR